VTRLLGGADLQFTSITEDRRFMVEKEEANSEKKGGWLKGLLGALGGMISGVVVMYLTPWVDKVAKPPKPVANFSVDYDGATVRFHNLSLTRGEGWWDFGDGSPLVPVSTDTEFLNHTYPRAGDFTAKLTIRNVLGEEDIRSAPVHIDGSLASAKPQVMSLLALPAHRGSDQGASYAIGIADGLQYALANANAGQLSVYAPATFRLIGQVEHAAMCLWDLGDDRPYQIKTDAGGALDVPVTFKKAGHYVVKLVAINGGDHDQRTVTIDVKDAPSNCVSLVLNVTDDATHVETTDRQVNLGVACPPDFTENVYPFRQSFKSSAGYTIGDVVIPPPMANARETQLGVQTAMCLNCPSLGLRSVQNLQLQLSPDRQTVTVTGELVRPADATGRLAHAALSMPMILKQQRRVPAHQSNPVTATLALPPPGTPSGVTLQLPPLPSDWTDGKRNVQMELHAGDQVVWQDSQLPRGAVVSIGVRRFIATATLVGDQMRLDLADAPTILPVSGTTK
jgi:PKD repeat protein